MAFPRTFNLLILRDLTRHNPTNVIQFYSVFPPTYVKPVYKKEEQEILYETKENEKLRHVPIKPATTHQTSSEFYDPSVRKFLNYIMREGNKDLARKLLEQTFENIKTTQLERYNRSSPEGKAKIELDPLVLFHRAIENCTPVLELEKIRKGGINYQVPIPIHNVRANFLAMNWLIQTAKEKDPNTRFHKVLAKEIIEASNNQGRTVKRKQELHRQCEANRAYAHFRWTK
ncbi:28S ribosomal protein S7, mitochondrial [Hylaeus anthracinus]|uniref:28S ribosomal protein S7, mitochondrial n=1 Tax=Hylaeus anthracinus TaxID=313031 RepID=UPI0023B9300D|nr:28S ribosomal protein S7, mitochondrial [Hylaeus anthracinus]